MSACEYCYETNCGKSIFYTPCCSDTFCPKTLYDYLKSKNKDKSNVNPICAICKSNMDVDTITTYANRLDTASEYKNLILDEVQERWRPIFICQSWVFLFFSFSFSLFPFSFSFLFLFFLRFMHIKIAVVFLN